ncbi:hypothetical protein LV469_06720 [Peptoniphilus sp. GNH]|nr:hypothetical protein LV469_06720 [Peptoniphilus sp. GNH]
MIDLIEYKIPKKMQYLPATRLLIGGLLLGKNVSLETVEDIKMAVGEALNISLLEEEPKELFILFEIGEKFVIKIKGIKKESLYKEENEMSKLIIESTVDKLEAENNQLILEKVLL